VFVQRLLGRCLTGDITEQIVPIFWGCGANGKSTLINAVMESIGGDYAMKANADLLMSSRNDRHPTELASLFGMHLVVASETHQGRSLNEALVMDLTGGERIRARRMREDFWEFMPTHKVILITSHKPIIKGGDDGIWRRLRLVSFEVRFWDPTEPETAERELPPELVQDKQLGEKLRKEYPGILGWMVRGCLDWQRDGLTTPAAVMDTTREYRSGEDLLAQFITECCVIGPDYRVRSSEINARFHGWCGAGNEETWTQRRLGEALVQRGFERYTNNGTWYRGLGLRQSDASPFKI
jgi:putative DNA primase/helicase